MRGGLQTVTATVLPRGFGDGFSVYLRTLRCGVVVPDSQLLFESGV